jgi:hypothetical protein
MVNESLVALRCRISRSGFPSEKVFRVTLASGAENVGAAPATYFFGEDRRPFPIDQPTQRMVRVPGFVAARIVERKPDGALLVSVPSGDVLLVRPDETTAYPGNGRDTERTPHVPVQP